MISFRAFLANLPPFKSYGGFKKIGAVNTFDTASTLDIKRHVTFTLGKSIKGTTFDQDCTALQQKIVFLQVLSRIKETIIMFPLFQTLVTFQSGEILPRIFS